METEYPTYKLGLSLKHTTWWVEWLRLLAGTGRTEVGSFAQGLGRLGFASRGPSMWMVGGPSGRRREATKARAATGGSGPAELLHGR